jgi:hypothetical protein
MTTSPQSRDDSGEYVPTMRAIANAYTFERVSQYGIASSAAHDEYVRALAAHDAQVRAAYAAKVQADTLRDAADDRYADEIQGAYTSAPDWLRARANSLWPADDEKDGE